MRNASVNVEAQPSPLVWASKHVVILTPVFRIGDETGANITDENDAPIISD